MIKTMLIMVILAIIGVPIWFVAVCMVLEVAESIYAHYQQTKPVPAPPVDPRIIQDNDTAKLVEKLKALKKSREQQIDIISRANDIVEQHIDNDDEVIKSYEQAWEQGKREDNGQQR